MDVNDPSWPKNVFKAPAEFAVVSNDFEKNDPWRWENYVRSGDLWVMERTKNSAAWGRSIFEGLWTYGASIWRALAEWVQPGFLWLPGRETTWAEKLKLVNGVWRPDRYSFMDKPLVNFGMFHKMKTMAKFADMYQQKYDPFFEKHEPFFAFDPASPEGSKTHFVTKKYSAPDCANLNMDVWMDPFGPAPSIDMEKMRKEYMKHCETKFAEALGPLPPPVHSMFDLLKDKMLQSMEIPKDVFAAGKPLFSKPPTFIGWSAFAGIPLQRRLDRDRKFFRVLDEVAGWVLLGYKQDDLEVVIDRRTDAVYVRPRRPKQGAKPQ